MKKVFFTVLALGAFLQSCQSGLSPEAIKQNETRIIDSTVAVQTKELTARLTAECDAKFNAAVEAKIAELTGVAGGIVVPAVGTSPVNAKIGATPIPGKGVPTKADPKKPTSETKPGTPGTSATAVPPAIVDKTPAVAPAKPTVINRGGAAVTATPAVTPATKPKVINRGGATKTE